MARGLIFTTPGKSGAPGAAGPPGPAGAPGQGSGLWVPGVNNEGALETIIGRAATSFNPTPDGKLVLSSLPHKLKAGVPYAKILFLPGYGGGAWTHLWLCVVDAATGKTLRSTADFPGSGIPGNAPFVKDLSSPLTPSSDTRVYLGYCCTGSDPPSPLIQGTANVQPWLAMACNGPAAPPADGTTVTTGAAFTANKPYLAISP